MSPANLDVLRELLTAALIAAFAYLAGWFVGAWVSRPRRRFRRVKRSHAQRLAAAREALLSPPRRPAMRPCFIYGATRDTIDYDGRLYTRVRGEAAWHAQAWPHEVSAELAVELTRLWADFLTNTKLRPSFGVQQKVDIADAPEYNDKH